LRHLDRMTERERYRTRGLFYGVTGDYQACVKEYGDLMARYPADVSGANNLALCSTFLRQMRPALDEMRRVVSILPKRALYRLNLALYAAYAGEAQTAETEARTAEKLGSPRGWLAIAFAQLLQNQLSEAADSYQKLAKVDELGASRSASGLGDLAVYEGRFSDAARILQEGGEVDLMAMQRDRAAAKFVALAHVRNLQRNKGAAISAAQKALANSHAVKIRFLTAQAFVEAGDTANAEKLGMDLAMELQAEPQALGKIIEGEIALKKGEPRQAIKPLTDARMLLDTWIGRFDLGRAYLEAGALPQADSEFDNCIQRHGEALSLFLDEEPNYGYLPPVYYYQGRVREALHNPGFAESYRIYLNDRGKANEDPLLREVRKRAGS